MVRSKLKIERREHDPVQWVVLNINDANWLEGQEIFAEFSTRAKARAWVKEHRKDFELDA
jgi:hypothetical protein